MTSDTPLTVCIVDDHWSVRQGVQSVIDAAEGMEVVGIATDGAECIDIIQTTNPDVVLMDLSMPNRGGIEAIQELSSLVPNTRIVVLSTFGEKHRVLAALDAGASGYLLKDSTPEELIAAIRDAAKGRAPLDSRAASALVDDRRSAESSRGAHTVQLSDRETEVLRLVMAGLLNKQIAGTLGITEATVKSHLTNVFQRLNVTDRTQAALWGERNLQKEQTPPLN